MKKTVRQYPKGCEWCNATGIEFRPPAGMTTSLTDVCPVCKGAGVIIVTETIMEHEDIHEPTNTFS